jgi:hypothetical protein
MLKKGQLGSRTVFAPTRSLFGVGDMLAYGTVGYFRDPFAHGRVAMFAK